MAQTSQYGLRQWAREEGLRQEDLNQAFAGVDQALAGAVAGINGTIAGLSAQVSARCRILTGVYTGSGQSGRVISLGLTPAAVIVKIPQHHSEYGFSNEVYYVPVIALRERDCGLLSVVEGGFQVTSHGLVNKSQTDYLYLAFHTL